MPIHAHGKTMATVAMDKAGPWSTRKTSKTAPAAYKAVKPAKRRFFDRNTQRKRIKP